MATAQFHDRRAWPACTLEPGEQAAAALAALGIEWGRWPLQVRPVSGTPLLSYARELLVLQRRFASVATDRVHQQRGERRGHPRAARSPTWPEVRVVHTHHDVEVRVLLSGTVRYLLPATTVNSWWAVQFEAGDWWSLPAGLPHRFEADPDRPLDMLRLFSRAGGWLAQAAAPQPPPHLLDGEAWLNQHNTACSALAA